LASDAPVPSRSAVAARATYVPALDGIRGIAIIWVVLHNATDMTLAPASGLAHAALLLTHPGWIGVQLFFALSGFLITGGLLDARGSPHYFRDFYARRALRILPLYYGVLVLLLVVVPAIPGLAGSIERGGQASLWLFTVNWTHTAPFGFAHFWSLAVEEQFYLLWPLLVWKLSARALLAACAAIAVAALLLRILLVTDGADWWTIYSNTACRMDALALGGAGACILRIGAWRVQLRSVAKRALWCATFILLLGIPLTHAYDRMLWSGETWGYSVLALFSAVLVVAVASGRATVPGLTAFLASSPLRSLGKYSYAMYVFHGLLNKFVGEPWLVSRYGAELPVWPVLAYSLVLLLVSYLMGYLSYQLYERHFLRMKRYFVPSPETHAAT
jgi:peptidoglycan/LPS O-acetylase OafA/YrhL